MNLTLSQRRTCTGFFYLQLEIQKIRQLKYLCHKMKDKRTGVLTEKADKSF